MPPNLEPIVLDREMKQAAVHGPLHFQIGTE